MVINKKNFNRFLLIKIPISIIVLLLFLELLAFLLSNHRAIRHGLDKKVAKIEYNNQKEFHKVILFGDSVTKDIADEFNFSSKENNLINLTTNRARGLIGSYMLYKKYTVNNTPPEYVIITSTPKFFTFLPENKTKELYLSSVFKSNEEKEVIANYYKNLIHEKYKISLVNYLKKSQLSVFNFEMKIGYPLIHALGLINFDNSLSTGNKKILSLAELSNIKDNSKIAYKRKTNEDTNLTISNNIQKLIEDFLIQLKKDNVKVYIAWAPMRKAYYQGIRVNGELKKLEDFLKEEANKIDLNLLLSDFSNEIQFPDKAFRDDDHLQIGYWRNFYAILLKDIIIKINDQF